MGGIDEVSMIRKREQGGTPTVEDNRPTFSMVMVLTINIVIILS
jgi:hypothetical protein